MKFSLMVLLFLLVSNGLHGTIEIGWKDFQVSSTLAGYVYDSFGNGIKDAIVSATEYTTSTEYTTTTDANGLFQFMGLSADKMYFVRISANGYYHRSKHDCVPGIPYSFVLERSAGVVGRITGNTGEPAKNATLVLSNPKFNVELYTYSDASGAFRFTSSNFENQLYPGDGYDIYASAEGYLSAILVKNLTVEKGVDIFVNFTLNKSGIVSGIVRGSTGERVKGARVCAYDQNGILVCANFTDDNGEYILNTDLSPGIYSAQVFPPVEPNGSWLNSQLLNISIPAIGAELKNIDFNLNPAAILRGNVSDENGAVANAMVTLSSDDGRFAYGVSDANGFFSISSPSLTTGAYTVRAECPHYLWAEKTVVLSEDTTVWVDLNLSKSRSVSGYLRTTSGTQLFGSVEIFDAEEKSIEKIYTSQEGYYKLDTNLVAGTFRVVACAPGYLTTSRTVDLTAAAEIENFNFTLSEAGKAVINITDHDGLRVANAIGSLIQRSGSSYTIWETRSSGANGTMVFGDGWENLQEGIYSLLVKNAPGCEEKFFENLIVIQQGTTNWYSLTLNKSAEVCGHVYYRKPTEPLADVHIEFISTDTSHPFTTFVGVLSDTDGYFHILKGLSGGEYTISASHYLYGSVALTETLSSGVKTEVNISFGTSSGNGCIFGLVKETNGNELKGVTVNVYNGTKKIKTGITNESGYFFLADIPEGKYRVTFTKEGYNTVEFQDVHVFAEETKDIGIVEMEKYIPPPGNITGYVVDVNGRPIPGASVLVEGTEISVISNSMGEFQIIGLKEGVYSLLISCPDYKDARETVSVTSGNNTTVWIQLEKEVPVKTTPDFTIIHILLIFVAMLIFTSKIQKKVKGRIIL